MYDLANNVATVLCLKPLIIDADTNGAGVDLAGYESAILVVNVGIEGDTLSGSVYWDITIQHSDDNSTFTDCTDADITNGTIAADGIWLKLDGTTGGDPDSTGLYSHVGYIGGKQYIRGQADATGTHSTGTSIGMCVIKGNAIHSSDNLITAHNA
jgi:hypothetical protein